MFNEVTMAKNVHRILTTWNLPLILNEHGWFVFLKVTKQVKFSIWGVFLLEFPSVTVPLLLPFIGIYCPTEVITTSNSCAWTQTIAGFFNITPLSTAISARGTEKFTAKWPANHTDNCLMWKDFAPLFPPNIAKFCRWLMRYWCEASPSVRGHTEAESWHLCATGGWGLWFESRF